MTVFAGWWLRARTAHGYGVHSPSAYRFITEALHPDAHLAYYADTRLNPLGRLLYRIAVHLGIADTLYLCSDTPRGDVQQALSLSGNACATRDPGPAIASQSSGCLIVIEGHPADVDDRLAEARGKGCDPLCVVFLDNGDPATRRRLSSLAGAVTYDMHQGPFIVVMSRRYSHGEYHL